MPVTVTYLLQSDTNLHRSWFSSHFVPVEEDDFKYIEVDRYVMLILHLNLYLKAPLEQIVR